MDNIDNLYRFIQKVASKVAKEQQFNNTVTGTIESSLPGFYEVRLTNGEKTSLVRATSLYSDKSYAVNDFVYLLSAQVASGDNFSTEYFIFGLVSAVEQNLANISDWERFVAGDEKIIISNLTLDGVSITNKGEKNFDFLQALRNEGVFAIEAKITAGNENKYGIQLDFTFDDGKTETRYFDTNWFTGQLGLLENSKQRKIFSLDRKDIVSIELTTFGGVKVADVSLIVGTLLNVVKNFSVSLENLSGKTFFNKNDKSQLIEIKAIPKYDNQILNTKSLKYYWFVEDESIEENVEGYSVLGGAGWRCLNEIETLKIVNEAGEIVDGDDVYIATSDILKLKSNEDEDDLKQYRNKIKCVVGYLLDNATSDPIEILNFKYEKYDIEVKITEGELPLLYESDTVTIEVQFTTSLFLPSEITTFYEWYKQDDEKGDELLDSYSKNILTVGFGKKEEENYYQITDNIVKIYCKAYIIDKDLNKSEIASSSSITVSSVSTDTNVKVIKEIEKYQYYIDIKNNTRFLSKESEKQNILIESSTGKAEYSDTYIYYKNESGAGLINVSAAAALDWLKGNEPFKEKEDGVYYLYYSKQILVVDENRNNAVLRYGDYSAPKILRGVEIQNGIIKDLLNSTTLEQLNVFNELTDSGKADGIFYKDATYSKTTDNVPQENKLITGRGYYKKVDTYEYQKVDINDFEDGIDYYIKNDNDEYIKVEDNADFNENIEYYISTLINIKYELLERNSDNYNLDNEGNPVVFKSDIDYYEQDGGDLYINATYIRSGILEVTKGENPIFRASIEDGEEAVQIGGYDVNEDSIQSENGVVGICSLEGSNTKAFWAGGKDNPKFSVTYDGILNASEAILSGTITATGGNIGGFHIAEDHLASGIAEKDDPHLVMISGAGWATDTSEVKYVFWAGPKKTDGDDSTRPFWIDNTGGMYAKKGQIASFSITEDALLAEAIYKDTEKEDTENTVFLPSYETVLKANRLYCTFIPYEEEYYGRLYTWSISPQELFIKSKEANSENSSSGLVIKSYFINKDYTKFDYVWENNISAISENLQLSEEKTFIDKIYQYGTGTYQINGTYSWEITLIKNGEKLEVNLNLSDIGFEYTGLGPFFATIIVTSMSKQYKTNTVENKAWISPWIEDSTDEIVNAGSLVIGSYRKNRENLGILDNPIREAGAWLEFSDYKTAVLHYDSALGGQWIIKDDETGKEYDLLKLIEKIESL